ncbi:MAG: hypothetical protein MI923_16295 [Phycisphaerales bacterium]|nr:hypothetical protein [Phycisphaerales bacterium]
MRPPRKQPRSDRLNDRWISIMHSLVGVENAIVSDATPPIRQARRAIMRFLANLDGEPKDWNANQLNFLLERRIRSAVEASMRSLKGDFDELPRRWILVQARALLRSIPGSRVVALRDHIQQTADRRRLKRLRQTAGLPPLTEDEPLVPRTTTGLSIADQLPGILDELFRILGDDEMEAYLQTDEARTYIGAAGRALNRTTDRVSDALAKIARFEGETDDIVDEAGHILRQAERDIETIARTQAQVISFDSFEILMEYAGPLVDVIKYTTMLDARVCLRCAAASRRHSKGLSPGLYRVNDPEMPEIPIHNLCRCAYVPVPKGAPPPRDETYDQWLKRQSDAKQREILGASRYDLFKSGVPADRFVNNRLRIIKVVDLPGASRKK